MLLLLTGRRRLLIATAATLLVALGCIVSAEAYEHTDDGCAVEIHCVPCQWHQGATVVLACVPQASVPTDGQHADVVISAPRIRKGSRLETASRAPPLAL